jgi:phage terminase large subunit
LAQRIQIPNKWEPREYQLPLWSALEDGCKRALYTWHRRAGKDDIGLHFTATEVIEKPGVYWYMLPEAAQARKAIWKAIDPHTGLRRIDWAFPPEIRASTNDTEMFINFKSGATWQVVGSDNYNSLVGSPPRGVVFSEWALANPAAWAYIRPILRENGGWALFNFTPRGRNHAVTMYEAHKDDPDWFIQKLTAKQTGAMTDEELAKELLDYQSDFGEEDGESKFRQEYLCDFDAPLVGAYYAKIISKLEDAGQIRDVPYDKHKPVYTAWDIGRTDDAAVWFYQIINREIHVIDYFAKPGGDVPEFAAMLQEKKYIYGKHTLPHDGRHKTFAAPRSVFEQLGEFVGLASVGICPDHHRIDGIAAVRAILPRCWFDAKRCKQGLEALRQYQRKWDDERKVFSPDPLHNWASHASDAFRYMAVAFKEENPTAFKSSTFRQPTLNEAWERQERFGHDEARI